jgi:molecular chaperone IbpA
MRLRTLDGLNIGSHIFVRARPQGLRKFNTPGSKSSGHQHIASQGGCDMRHFDLTPLYRSTIGFDRLGSLLDTLGAFEGDTPSYPPYNIERVGENEYRISMAVAGFGEKDLTIEVKENTLSIRGEKQTEVEQSTYLHRGIAGRSFERRFQLADHVVVKGASLEHGLLHVDLVRELPEAMKPRTIPIETKSDKPRVIDSKAA